MGDLLQALGLHGALRVQERCWYLLPLRFLLSLAQEVAKVEDVIIQMTQY